MLPELPVHPRVIEELIENGLDEFDPSDADIIPLPEDMELLSQYHPKKGISTDH